MILFYRTEYKNRFISSNTSARALYYEMYYYFFFIFLVSKLALSIASCVFSSVIRTFQNSGIERKNTPKIEKKNLFGIVRKCLN